MKKLVVLLLALSMVVGAAFAQDKPAMSFSMYSEWYAGLYSSADKTIMDGSYTTLTAAYKADDISFALTTQTSAASTGQDFFTTPRDWYVSYKMFDGKVTLSYGDLRMDGGARLTSYIEGNGFSTRLANADKNNGAMVKVDAIEGLSIAVFAPLTGIMDDYASTSFGVGYTIADIAKIVASYRMANDELAIGVDLKAVENLTARVGFKYIMNDPADDVSYIYATAGYVMDALDLGLDAAIGLETETVFGVEAQAAYNMDPFTFALCVSYGNDDRGTSATNWFGDGAVIYPYLVRHFSAGDIEAGFKYETADKAWSIPVTFYLSF